MSNLITAAERFSKITDRVAYSYKNDFIAASVALAYHDWNQRSWQYKMWTDEAKNATMVFRTKAMEALWNEELTGQFSDGAWENDPSESWYYWSYVKTSVGGQTSLRGVVPYGVKRGFRLTDLMQYIDDRMLKIVQKYEKDATMQTVRDYLIEIQEAMRKGKAEARGGTELPLGKDIKRIEDMVKKSTDSDGNVDEGKLKSFAERMAKSIKDLEKCIRRGKAAEQAGQQMVADIFFNRSKELGRK